MKYYLLAGAIAAVVSFCMSWIVWKLGLRYGWYPKVRERDVHRTPTPRLGGIAMYIGVIVAMLAAWFLFPSIAGTDYFRLVFSEPGRVLAVLGGATIIVVLGVADDIWDLDWMTKLAGQIIAAGILAWQGVAIVSLPIGNTLGVGSSYMSLIFTVLAVVLVMNAVNFIDGLDGLVAGVAIIAGGVFFLYTFFINRVVVQTEFFFNLPSLLTAVLVGACFGFLILNWHPAKLFMGDAGALLVGFLMATSAVSVTGNIDPAAVQTRQALLPAFIPILLPFAILIVPILDFGLAVTRRLSAGKSPFSADRKHLHHRLLDMGHSHFHAVLIFYAWTATVAFGCLLFLFVDWYWVLTFVAVGFTVCAVATFAPLGRKRAEFAAQAATRSSPVVDARLDPLDRAANDRSIPGDPS
ncbi:undecaprenyl/decaprenyl-phosphate alpha-N-acetylglucosaminyl 1-phosphate transferase [Curtobacterium sp. C1]|uniref:Undecaprenyl/decaprenyl-phosphate alpha-N-acetylglucosaminyl 1-phosphate transferase n=1 Tax=Curtobacterium citreum TaxID=2036 RepID=A0A850DTH2_9MICO|nr:MULTISPECIES: MraY family glycosyltransferase [Curtobacterium]MCS5488564.1 undecaprenyl/decaprenyl-phosphate alpha-N-acetylglucosaminyl 1-phosphate transferase [Curtobacterium flaccumfaciens pv. basellae]NUU28896.1 undecaprenyl/decaprenyl-phosphate alpha-N-acetylglucosaminyl 1-phosphate transferase [Curtobacterium albidum]MCS6521466.1 undecaprenyl/decaprenyl-phosphate alpha-N-acetylglucosaminyl 1-phosphate transferase [Curtobacterium citreum]MDK8171225.1 MraY family glycosyltransferase [Curt